MVLDGSKGYIPSGAGSPATLLIKEVEGKLDDSTHGLAALKILIDDIEIKLDSPVSGLALLLGYLVTIDTNIGDLSGDTLISLATKWGDIARSLDLILGNRWDIAGDLGTDVTALIATLAVVDVEVGNIEGKLDSGVHGLAALKALIDAIKAITDALPDAGALTTIQADLDNPDQYKADLTTLETRLSAIRAGYLDQLDFDLQEAIAALQTDLDNPAQYRADVAALALEATLTAIKGVGWTTETLKAIKDAIDAIGPGGDATEAKQDLIEAKLDLQDRESNYSTIFFITSYFSSNTIEYGGNLGRHAIDYFNIHYDDA